MRRAGEPGGAAQGGQEGPKPEWEGRARERVGSGSQGHRGAREDPGCGPNGQHLMGVTKNSIAQGGRKPAFPNEKGS